MSAVEDKSEVSPIAPPEEKDDNQGQRTALEINSRSSLDQGGSVHLDKFLMNDPKTPTSKHNIGEPSDEAHIRLYIAKLTERLQSYVPETLGACISTRPIAVPMRMHCEAVVMLCDVSGFTKLSEELCAKGPAGVDELSKTISRLFESLIRIVQEHGGDVINFAGDALLIAWLTPLGLSSEKSKAVHKQHCGQAFACGIALAKMKYQLNLTVHVGISTGKLFFLVVGGVGKYYTWMMVGKPLQRMGHAESLAKSGQVVVTKEGFLLVAEWFNGIELTSEGKPAGNESEACGLVLLESAKGDWQQTASGPILLLSISNSIECAAYEKEDRESTLLPQLKAKSSIATLSLKASNIRSFLPAPARQSVEGNCLFINEFREHVAVLFVMLENFDIELYSEDLDGKAVADKLHNVFTSAQQVISTYNGMIRQFLIDDKGCVLIVVFGVSGYRHYNDPVRAIGCACTLVDAFSELCVDAYIGITYGEAFCGAVGTDIRREYALVGKTVNLSARLMALAFKLSQPTEKKSMIVISPRLQKKLKKRDLSVIALNALEPVKLKGIECKVPVFEAMKAPDFSVERIISSEDLTYGRTDEIQRVMEDLKSRSKRVKVTLIRGDQGLGKTVFLDMIKPEVSKLGYLAISANCFKSKKSSPYYVIRQVILQLLGVNLDVDWDDFVSVNQQREHERERVSSLLENIARNLLASRKAILKASSSETHGEIKNERKKWRKDATQQFKSQSMTMPKILLEEARLHWDLSHLQETPAHLPFKRNSISVQGTCPTEAAVLNYQRVLFPIIREVLDLDWDLTTKETNKKAPKKHPYKQVRAAFSYQIFCALLKGMEKPPAIFVENIEWIDSASLQLLIELFHVMKVESNGICFISSQKRLKDLNSLFEIFKSAYEPTEVELQPLSTEDIKKIMQDEMNHMSYATAMDNLSQESIDYVLENSNGNPFRCKELTKGILLKMSDLSHGDKDGGATGTGSGQGSGANDNSKSIRDAIGSSIQARFDKLPTNLKNILKTASVIGKTFSLDELSQILLRSITRKLNLHIALDDLCVDNWINATTSTGNYEFSNGTVQEVIYGLNTKSFQSRIHLACTRYIEKRYGDDLRAYFSTLASHYSAAEASKQAFRYHILSITFSLSYFALEDALNTTEIALQLPVGTAHIKKLIDAIETEGKFLKNEFDESAITGDRPKMNEGNRTETPERDIQQLNERRAEVIEEIMAKVDKKYNEVLAQEMEANGFKEEQSDSEAQSKACIIL